MSTLAMNAPDDLLRNRRWSTLLDAARSATPRTYVRARETPTAGPRTSLDRSLADLLVALPEGEQPGRNAGRVVAALVE
jgi:hypothetical protein